MELYAAFANGQKHSPLRMLPRSSSARLLVQTFMKSKPVARRLPIDSARVQQVHTSPFGAICADARPA